MTCVWLLALHTSVQWNEPSSPHDATSSGASMSVADSLTFSTWSFSTHLDPFGVVVLYYGTRVLGQACHRTIVTESVLFSHQMERPSSFHVWWTATRPHTLTAGLSPCIVGYALTRPPWDIQLAWTLFCITVQIGTNLHNDYSDFIQGADTDKRVGHARATAKGWLTPEETCTAATLCLSITFLCGLYLATVTEQLSNPIVWFLIVSSIFNAFAYTAGPYPLGYIGLEKWSIAYSGLGEIFVLLYVRVSLSLSCTTSTIHSPGLSSSIYSLATLQLSCCHTSLTVKGGT